jgi:hypothetical protein
MLDTVNLFSGNDIPIWDWNKSAKFLVKFVYKDLSSYRIDRSFKHLWKAKIPLKIKIWLWLIWHNAIATKDTCLQEVEQEMSDVNSLSRMKQYITYSLPALLPNMSGVVWQDP